MVGNGGRNGETNISMSAALNFGCRSGWFPDPKQTGVKKNTQQHCVYVYWKKKKKNTK